MMYVIQKIKGEIYSYSSRLLRVIIILTILALIIEPITWIFDTKTFSGARLINYSSNFLLVLIAPILIGMWASYLDFQLFGDRKRLSARHFYQYPSYLMLVLLVVNFFFPVFFSISADNVYAESSLFWIRLVIIYAVIVYLVVLIIIHRQNIRTNALYGVAAFFVLPTLGSILQLLDQEVFFTWTTLALSVVVVYIFLETTSGNRDYLTNLYSRRALEDYLEHLLDQKIRFTSIMIDLDHFKEVNDEFGHHEGDLVLSEYSKVLKSAFGPRSFVARFGGDEFFAVIRNVDQIDHAKAIAKVYDDLKINRMTAKYPFMSFSYGIVVDDGLMTLDEIFVLSDKRMYDHKNSRRTDSPSQSAQKTS